MLPEIGKQVLEPKIDALVLEATKLNKLDTRRPIPDKIPWAFIPKSFVNVESPESLIKRDMTPFYNTKLKQLKRPKLLFHKLNIL